MPNDNYLSASDRKQVAAHVKTIENVKSHVSMREGWVMLYAQDGRTWAGGRRVLSLNRRYFASLEDLLKAIDLKTARDSKQEIVGEAVDLIKTAIKMLDETFEDEYYTESVALSELAVHVVEAFHASKHGDYFDRMRYTNQAKSVPVDVTIAHSLMDSIDDRY